MGSCSSRSRHSLQSSGRQVAALPAETRMRGGLGLVQERGGGGRMAAELSVERRLDAGDEIEDDDDDDLDESLAERLWGLTEMFPEGVRNASGVAASCSLTLAKKLYSFTRSALWVGTTSFMILILPVVFETEKLQLEQQQIQQQRQILLGPNTGMSGGMPGMLPPPVPGKI